jgi:hypothetical protein
MTTDDIETIAILVQTKEGAAHQVFANKELKEIFLRLLVGENGDLNISKELKPITFEYLTK